MKVTGIICEYNPFHRGHQYQLEQVKRTADGCVCVMSGNFVQRGEPACVSKFDRAEAAVRNGADLVLELPAVYACRSAEQFARGGVLMLAHTGIVTHLSFGSESGDLRLLTEAASFFSAESAEYKTALGEGLALGLSFPAARLRAVKNLPFAPLLQSPNDLLGVEYCKAILQIAPSLIPQPLLRRGCGHDAPEPTGTVCSASYLRTHSEELELYSPASHILREGGFPLSSALFGDLLLAHLRRIVPSELSQAADCTEGLEYRLKQAASRAESWEEAVSLAQSKRYPSSRVRRIALCSYLNIKKQEYPPEYLRVLAANRCGAALLRQLKKTASLPVITNLSKQQINSQALSIDVAAGDFYALLQQKNRRGGMDYTVSPRFVE